MALTPHSAVDQKPERTLGLLAFIVFVFVLLAIALPVSAKEKDGVQYGMGLIVNVPFPENEVERVVQDAAQNGIIRGTKEYNKDEYISGAAAADSTRVFPQWTEGGKVFYKVRLKTLDPRNFKDSSDVGTLAVRYILQGQGDKNTVLRIDAVFVEDFRHVAHPSNGSVEGAEYKDIHDHLDAIDLMKTQTAEAQKEKEQRTMAQKAVLVGSSNGMLAQPAASVAKADPPTDVSTPASEESLEQHVQNLRREVERLVKQPGAALRSAPFHTATTTRSLPGGTEVLIVVSTPYWFGVETHEGQHGWMLRDDLELLP